MVAQHVFISHASADDPIVARLRTALEALGIAVWTDSQHLRGGKRLEGEIFAAIEKAEHFIVLVTQKSLASNWVEKELKHARKIQKKRGDGYQVIPILLDGLLPNVLAGFFGAKEPVAVMMSSGAGGVQNALDDLLAALGEQAPVDPQRPDAKAASAIAELTLTLTDASIDRTGGKHRAAARAMLIYHPPDGSGKVESYPYRFTAPLGPIEAEALAWYLERYAHWPSGPFQDRARDVEQKLPAWGRSLYAAVASDEARQPLDAWRAAGKNHPRRFTVLVDPAVVKGSPADMRQDAAEAATLLLGLPWELVHDERDYLFQAAPGVHVRRRLPNRAQRDPVVTDPPIRVLLVSPRPEDDHAGYIDHRVSARPVAESLAQLGELAELTLLSPPTFQALDAELRRAHEAGTPYHVVHFDGHGVYDKQHGLGALCFEHADDGAKLTRRKSDIVAADALAKVVQKYRVPVFFLEACETAVAKTDPTASVAGMLLQHGVNSVVAMSHTVLVETARRFVTAFYVALIEGRRVGEAMLAAQRALKEDPFRGKTFIGPLHLQDWFVPVLFQEEHDPQLIKHVPAARVQAILKKQRELALGKVPPPPDQTFVGRSRELLTAERLLEREPYAVLRGQGGEGKTTLAAELARWLVATHRFRRAAFASLETHSDAHAVLSVLGEQLVPSYVAESAQDDKRGLQLVERALAQQPTLLVFDNMESVLAPAVGSPAEAAFEPEVLTTIIELCTQLGKIGRTRLVFTTREPMPAPFDKHHVTIDRLDRPDAIELVGRVLGENELMPHVADLGEKSEQEIDNLVEAVNCHARSLVLLPQEIVRSGVRNATRQLNELMAALHKKHPDDRERSLLASVELSLRRLPATTRQKIRRLGVFQGGGHLWAIATVLGLDAEKNEHVEIAKHLIAVGLAELQAYGYLQLNPALGPALLGELNDEEREAAQAAWAEAMAQFTGFLYQQQSKDPNMAFTLALLDLANLLAGLEHLHKTAEPDLVIEVATSIETLAAHLGRPKALARATKIRAEATPKQGDWSHAGHTAAFAAIERLLEAGRFPQAIATAQALVQKAVAACDNAYSVAGYDLASAHWLLGRTLKMGGDSQAALGPIDEARRRFEALAKAGDKSASRMASLCQTESGDCLTNLGRLDEAAEGYEAKSPCAIQLHGSRGVHLSAAEIKKWESSHKLRAHEAPRRIPMALILPKPGFFVKQRFEKRFQECRQALVRVRYLIIINVWNGRSARAIEQMLKVHNTTVYRVVKRFRERGEASLWDGREDNGVEKLSEDFLGLLDQIVRSNPQDHGWRRPTWTRELLVETMVRKTGIRVHVATMSRALALIRARRANPRPRVKCPWHPAVKTRRLNALRLLLATLPRREAAVYEDEVDIHLNPKIGLDWMGKGQQKEAWTPGQNEKRYLAGAMDVRTGEIHWVEAERKDSWLFLDMLHKLTKVYAQAPVIHVILDNYGIHSSKIIAVALSHFAARVRLHFLPPYSPDHNAIERVWQDLHANVTRNHRCADMAELMREVRYYLRKRNRRSLRPRQTATAA